ncbi:MAG: HD domain-containing protein [Chloroflexi bacterium]|nr:HD domain-containing protein [Chloroflexota bacterium]
MLIPTLPQAQALLTEAGALNPGPWTAHSEHVAEGARLIASRLSGVDPEAAYILGLLHDIGRRAGVTGMRHVLDGYRFLDELGFADAGRISMTHSFPNRDVREIFGEWDCDAAELAFITDYLSAAAYDDYDRLIQLCDSLAMASGFCLMEKRMLDVAFRYGINVYSIPKWKTKFGIKADFERRMGCSVYALLPGVVENTFGLQIADCGLQK